MSIYILYFNLHLELLIISGSLVWSSIYSGVCVVMSYSGKTLSSVSRRVADVRFRNKSSQLGGPDTGRRANVWKKILDDVCDQCSLHGLNHIVGKDRSTGEKSVSTRKTENITISINIEMLLYILGIELGRGFYNVLKNKSIIPLKNTMTIHVPIILQNFIKWYAAPKIFLYLQ